MDTVTLTSAEYQDLIDARDHAIAMREVATGAMETIGESEVDAYLAAPSPLAFWRKKRGLGQVEMAAKVGISQGYLAQLERGRRVGDILLFAKLAAALNLRVDDLVPDEPETEATQLAEIAEASPVHLEK